MSKRIDNGSMKGFWAILKENATVGNDLQIEKHL